MIKEKKIIVVGCPGSGKSYFARQLREITGYPIHYLDVMYWKENWVGREDEEFDSMLRAVINTDSWIIDGNYNRTMEMRFAKAELIFFFDLPTEVCIQNALARTGTKREDLPDYLNEEYDPDFVDFIKNFKNSGRVKFFELCDKYKDKKVIIFHSWDEKNEYLKSITD